MGNKEDLTEEFSPQEIKELFKESEYIEKMALARCGELYYESP